MKHTLKVKGMHCASCASIVERTLKKQVGVDSAEVNYGNESAKISFDSEKTNMENLAAAIKPLGYSFVMEKHEHGHSMGAMDHSMGHAMAVNQTKEEKLEDLRKMKRKLLLAIPLALVSIFIMGWDILAQFKKAPEMSYVWSEFFHHLLPIMATYMLVVVGKPYLVGVSRFLRHGVANMDSLIGIGTVVAFIYSFIVTAFEESLKPFLNVDATYYDVVIVVIAFISLGKYLEAKSKLKTGDAIEKLLNLQAKTALVVRGGKEIEVPVEQVVHGDLIVVKPGSKIPVDGIITEGSSFIDEAMVTGEPMPAEKKAGDTVVSGTINTNGSFIFKATKIGSETLLAHIVKMVEEAQGSKAPIQALADKIASVFVPIVLVIAVLSLILWLVIGASYLGFAQALSFGLTSFVGVLVIACPCALGLATPTAIIVGVGKGAREGILVKDAATLEKFHKVKVVVVDKTGTITKGKPELIAVQKMASLAENEIVSVLASLEKKSEHPIAHAVVSYAENKKIELKKVEGFEVIKGKGLKASVEGVEYYAGNERLVRELGLEFDVAVVAEETNKGRTPVVLMTKKEVVGVVLVADALKENSKEAVENLHKLGIKVVMLTGDDKNTAAFIAKEVGIDEVVAEVLPEDKLNRVKEFQAQGFVVAMAGDGINDAPALAQADIGIAMGTGTDVAIESAGITLLHGDISKIVKSIRLSRLTMRGIKQNLFWAFIYNIVGIPIATGVFYPVFGWTLSPVFAGLAMAFSSVSVVSNSLRLKAVKL